MVEINPDANFYSLAGVSVHENDSEEYREYRRSWIELPKNFILRSFPMHLDIETTNCCNISCTFCDKLPLLKDQRMGYMEFNLYKKIIDEGAQHRLWGVKLSYRGEPLLHKDIVDMVAYAKKKGIIDIYFNTNGMLLDERMSKKLIDAGLIRISVSVESTNSFEFEKCRIGAKFDTILKNIETLLELRRKIGVSHPKVRVQTIRMADNDFESYRSFWKDYCDEVAAVDYKNSCQREKGISYNWACPQLWQRMTINWEGIISPCNNDDFCLLSPGSVKEKTIYECWHDLKVEKARELHKIGQSHKVEACDGCPWRTAQIHKLQR